MPNLHIPLKRALVLCLVAAIVATVFARWRSQNLEIGGVSLGMSVDEYRKVASTAPVALMRCMPWKPVPEVPTTKRPFASCAAAVMERPLGKVEAKAGMREPAGVRMVTVAESEWALPLALVTTAR